MAKFQSLPKIVEATQWYPGIKIEGLSEHTDWNQEDKYGIVETIHGQKTRVTPGDYVITEPDGLHHYPCKPDIFEKSYRPYENP